MARFSVIPHRTPKRRAAVRRSGTATAQASGARSGRMVASASVGYRWRMRLRPPDQRPELAPCEKVEDDSGADNGNGRPARLVPPACSVPANALATCYKQSHDDPRRPEWALAGRPQRDAVGGDTGRIMDPHGRRRRQPEHPAAAKRGAPEPAGGSALILRQPFETVCPHEVTWQITEAGRKAIAEYALSSPAPTATPRSRA
jgi:hypothetical protein